MSDEFLRVWVTKQALTAGIRQVTVSRAKTAPDMVVHLNGRYMEFFHGEGREWHLTLEGAVARAGQMRAAKLASLEKQIKRVKALKFEERDEPRANEAIAQ